MHNLRFADPTTVNQYPLPIAGPAEWRPAGDDTWRVTIPLPSLAAGDMLAPSVSVLNRNSYRMCSSLVTDAKSYALRCFPTASGVAHVDPGDDRVRTAIDCFHVAAAPGESCLDVCLAGVSRPERYLLTVSIRPAELDTVPAGPLPSLFAPAPPRRSQMLANPRIAARICSPMSTAMVIGTHCPEVDYAAVVDDCLDPVTGMYGLWPLAIRAASRYGLIGAIELVDDWQPVLACLARGLPVVASIRYAIDALAGAP